MHYLFNGMGFVLFLMGASVGGLLNWIGAKEELATAIAMVLVGALDFAIRNAAIDDITYQPYGKWFAPVVGGSFLTAPFWVFGVAGIFGVWDALKIKF